MRSVKISLLFLMICFISYQGFSQDKIEEGIYLSEDKLTVITILPKNEISYMEYNYFSPYSDSLKELQKNQFCGTMLYEVLKSGYGNYSSNNNNLKITFKAGLKSLDSSSVTTLYTIQKRDSIVLKFRMNSYPENDQENFVYDVHIRSDDNTININTSFENQVELKLPKNNNEITFWINDYYKLKVKPENNLAINLNFNLYKTMLTENLKDKIVDFSSFSKVLR